MRLKIIEDNGSPCLTPWFGGAGADDHPLSVRIVLESLYVFALPIAYKILLYIEQVEYSNYRITLLSEDFPQYGSMILSCWLDFFMILPRFQTVEVFFERVILLFHGNVSNLNQVIMPKKFLSIGLHRNIISCRSPMSLVSFHRSRRELFSQGYVLESDVRIKTQLFFSTRQRSRFLISPSIFHPHYVRQTCVSRMDLPTMLFEVTIWCKYSSASGKSKAD